MSGRRRTGPSLRDRWELWTDGMNAKRWGYFALAVLGAAVLLVGPLAAALWNADRTACGELEATVVTADAITRVSRFGEPRRIVQQIVEAEDGHRYQLHYGGSLELGDRVRIITLCDGRGEKLFRAQVRRVG